MYAADPTTTITVTLSPTAVTFTAGGAPYSVTATVAGASAEVGLPISWSIGGAGAGSVSPASGTTGSGGVAHATYTPSNVALDSNYVVATLGTNTPVAAASATAFPSGSSAATTTQAASPSKVTFYLGAVGSANFFPSTHYVTTGSAGAANGACAAAPACATITGPGNLLFAVTDAFTNPIAVGAGGVTFATGQGITLTALSGAGYFDTATAPATVSCTTTAVCNAGPWSTTTTSWQAPYNYYQSGTYGTLGLISATITGTYNLASFSVSGSTGKIVTSTFQAAPTPNVSFPAADVSPVTAGGQVLLKDVIGQKGVPVTFYLNVAAVATEVNGDGHFAGNGQNSITVVAGANGTAVASYLVDTGNGAVATFLANAAAPIDGTPTNMLGNSTTAEPVGGFTTQAGTASKFIINTYFDAGLATKSTKSVAGGNLYIDVVLTDAYGNTATVVAPTAQIQITLSASSGLLSATNVYISSGNSKTSTSFGTIQYTAPSATGKVTISATGVYNGKAITATAAVTVVSKTPVLVVTSPAPLNGVIYAGSTPVVFTGQANVSVGYPSSVLISSVDYTLGTGSSGSVIIASASSVSWSVAISLPAGLSTISFNTTDAKTNTVSTSTYTVLVDTGAPSVDFLTAANANISSPATISASLVDGMGDLNMSSGGVTAVATNIQTSATKTLTAKVTGTINPGHSETYGVTISGLTTGNWTVVLSAADLAGNTNSSTITVHVTVPFAQSFTVSGTPSATSVGSFAGISASYTNLNPTSQSVVVFAVFKNSAGQTMGIGTGSATIGAGATQAVFIADPVGLAAGTYSVHISVFTTGNLPVSVQTTISVTV